MFTDLLQIQMKKQGTVIFQCNGSRLACQNFNFCHGGTAEEKQAVWVKNSHDLFDSEQATEWVLTPTSFKEDTQDGPNTFFIEKHFEDDCAAFSDHSVWRLVLNQSTGSLELVNQLSNAFKDYDQTNKWILIHI